MVYPSTFFPRCKGFTLIEVVLALGVFFISILALIGLLAPMLRSVDEIEKIDEITSVVNTVNAFLQSSPEIAVRDGDGKVTKTTFNAVYEAVVDGGEATIFVYRYYDSSDVIRLEVGFSSEEEDAAHVGPNSVVNPANFNNAAGPIFRVVLSASSVTPLLPDALRTDPRNSDGIYTLTQASPADYPEGYLALEVRIFAEEPPGPSPAVFETLTNLADLSEREPDFTFNAAILR